MFRNICLALLLFVEVAVCVQKLQEHFQWNILDYEFPTEAIRRNALLTGRFKPENNLPVGMEIWQDKLFISVPRWKEGIPATLNYVPLNSPVKNPRLIPYPDFPSNELGNCENGLNTVYRMKADECERLWVLDTGTFGIENTTQNPCPYALNIFDLKTNRRIRRYEFRPEDTNSDTFIANIAVELGATCDDAHAYFSDELGYGLIVYSFKENQSWRFSHSYFLPDPLRGDFTINNLNFQWGEEGIFGLSLTPVQPDGYRLLYFSPLASHREFVVSTKTLQNSSKVGDSWKEFYPLNERGPDSHTTSRVMDENGIQFFNLIDQNAVGCWNSETPYTARNHEVVDKDDKGLIFPSDVKVDRNRNLWVISDRMSDFLLASLDFNDINFRVYFAPIDVLIKNTVCESRKYDGIFGYDNQHFSKFPSHKYYSIYGGNFLV
ncbi:protein yellow isoform X2 [Diabrotica virgifera virgifera]|nr:protein yellow isoform X2 [Diabrotica virgifera virgifera]XP_050514592.1 protein yellow isoform X2 [Diabrotica virgifera virgifera]XP_050514593.1 protein yellow isoform X2 [Diabrotica virgifera virgifera]